MKQRQIPWVNPYLIEKSFKTSIKVLSLLAVMLFIDGCKKEGARMTRVYGKVTDQTGQPVDSVTILFAGGLGFSAGFPIKQTLTDSTGMYELVVDVPKRYDFAGIVTSLDYESLRSQYSSQNQLIYENDVQKGSCCNVPIGRKTKYDFVLLPK